MNLIVSEKKNVPINWELDFDSGIDLEDDLIRKELKIRIDLCFEKMPVLYREPLTLHFLEDKSYGEIGDILRIPVGTVGTRINRAKILMKKICKK